ncbi:hypothetical protein [Gilvimarinus sp. DA14]|uniref:hypothetical protein n=1 Tax=Gilvimarinus sp. DA14 TaxID=2956798 RepID=UPI0020B72B7C|nr:hypothetical protein [Gilvimarinus sp. DA14]UTF61380.1 hypothetical protein NHM04_06170 [Gilvimarinus sp. DA14]
MPSLYQSSTETSVSISGLYSQTLQLTAIMLRESEPALARSLNELVHVQDPHADHPIDGYLLFDSLGAEQIGKIIASLTSIGNSWLAAPSHSPSSMRSMQALLKEWIELAEWLIKHGEIH